MVRILFAAAVLSLAAAPTLAAPCKDAKGKFVKCPTITKGKDGKCRFADGPNRGKFVKCR